MIRVLPALFAISLSALLLGCAGTRGDHTMSQGERLFRANCRSCHVLPKPVKYDDAAWDSLVHRYGGRIRLSEEDLAEIISYVQFANDDTTQ